MFRKRITPSLVLSVVAVVLASAGTSVATVAITGKQVKDGSLTGADVRNRSLTGADVKDHSLTATDIRRGGVTRAAIADSTASTLQATPVEATKVEASEAIPAKHSAEVSVDCPAGQVALGGGGSLVNTPNGGLIRYSLPKLDATGTPVGWTVNVFNDTGPGGAAVDDTALAFAICSP